jgi:hypothetical protein
MLDIFPLFADRIPYSWYQRPMGAEPVMKKSVSVGIIYDPLDLKYGL